MTWLADALRGNPALALFLVLALGYALGQVRLGGFKPGPVVGTLIAGLIVGQLRIPVPAAMKTAFFLMFLFAIGFRTGPEFFRSLRASAIPQAALAITLNVTGVALTFLVARAFSFDGGTAAGLLAGALTNSTALGTATDATARLGVDPAAAAQLAHNAATAYAMTYPLGALLVVWFLPNVGPWLMRVNLREACREFERAAGISAKDRSVSSAYHEVTVRAYRLPSTLDGRTVADVESQWKPDRRAIIVRVRRGGAMLDAAPRMQLRANDVVAVAGRSSTLVDDSNPLEDQEVDDRELLDVPTVSADLVLTNRNLAPQSLRGIAEHVAARGIFLMSLRRAGQQLPFTPSTIVERGDVLHVSGGRDEIARVAREIGYAEYPTTATDLLLVAMTIFIGGLVGLVAVTIGEMTFSLSVSVGVLLAALTLGYLRSIHPRFGRVPEASVALFQSLGLSGFLALVGLQAGPGAVEALRTSGGAILLASAFITLVPHLLTVLIGHYVVGMHPGVLLGVCAGAGTSAPTLGALESAADSKVPALGYGMACALGNVLMAVWGTLIVLTIGG